MTGPDLAGAMQVLQSAAAFAGAFVAPVLVWLVATRVQWRGVQVQERTERVKAEDSLSVRLNTLVDQLQAERDHWAVSHRSLLTDLEQLRGARYALEDTLMQVRDGALAARVMVHDLERRLGLPETRFDPLPYPGLAPRPPPPA